MRNAVELPIIASSQRLTGAGAPDASALSSAVGVLARRGAGRLPARGLGKSRQLLTQRVHRLEGLLDWARRAARPMPT